MLLFCVVVIYDITINFYLCHCLRHNRKKNCTHVLSFDITHSLLCYIDLLH